MSTIHSTSPFDRAARADAASGTAGALRSALPGRDQFSARQAGALQSALQSHPEVRPEVVARGRLLTADPDYPSAAVLTKVASAILASPDLTED